MNFRKLITYLTMGTAAAMPLAVAQNPTILQGNYITNVFGNSNFVLNPNAQTNIANVTVSSATVTRSTTTPLVATSEFNITTSTSTGYADWSTRTFDAGMKGQNCEARFSYRGFSVGSTTAQILQGANVVAQLTLTASTDPRIASINFPCGDLSSATTFRLQQATASLTGTNEIGGIYVGLATNMANVAQATKVGGFDSVSCSGEPSLTTGTAGTWYAPNVAGTCTGVAVGLASATSSNLNTLTFAFNNLPPGEYLLLMPGYVYPTPPGVGTGRCDGRIRETTLNIIDGQNAFGRTNTTEWLSIGQINQFKFTNTVTGNRTFQIEFQRNGGTSWQCAGGIINTQQNVSLYRFPSSSELVVKPETQNVFGGVKFTGGSSTLFNAVAPSTTFANYTDATNWKPTSAGGTGTYYGKATSTTTTGELGLKIPNMPAGTYRMTVRGNVFPDASAGASGQYTACTIELYETTTAAGFAKNYQFTGHGAAATIPGPGDFSGQLLMDGIFANTSVADRNFIVRAQKLYDSTAGNVGKCLSTTFNSDIVITIQPLDQPSNSALYVEGPVKASATGAAIPAGYVGEILSNSDNTYVNTTSATYNVLSLALTPGVWDVQGKCDFDRGGATITTANWIAAIVNQDVNPSEGVLTQFAGGTFASLDAIRLLTQPSRVTWNGTTNVTPGSGNTSSNLVYVRCYPSTFTGGPVRVWRTIWARRLN